MSLLPPQEEAELLRKLNKERKDVAPQGAQGAAGEGAGDGKANGAAPAAAAAPAPPAGSDEAAMAARLVAVYQRLQEIDAYGGCGRGVAWGWAAGFILAQWEYRRRDVPCKPRHGPTPRGKPRCMT